LGCSDHSGESVPPDPMRTGSSRVAHGSLPAYASFPAYIKRGFESSFLRILDILCHFRVFLSYFIRVLAYFSTYVCILRKIRALYGCIHILRRIIRNTLLTYITYATATAYNWLNIRVWTNPNLNPASGVSSSVSSKYV
jgi:hypothetical protein